LILCLFTHALSAAWVMLQQVVGWFGKDVEESD